MRDAGELEYPATDTLVSHPYFPVDVNAPDSNWTVIRYTYDPIYLIQSLMSAFPAGTGGSSQTSQTPDQVAIADIQARASSDQRFLNLANGTNLGRDATWGQGGQPGDLTTLTWLVYNFSGGRQVQIFHAVANNNQNLRYTTYFDPDRGGWASWQQAK